MKQLLDSKVQDIPQLAIDLENILQDYIFSAVSLFDLHSPETYRLLCLHHYENDLEKIRMALHEEQIHSIPRLYNLSACKINGQWFFEKLEPINANRLTKRGYYHVEAEKKIGKYYTERKKE